MSVPMTPLRPRQNMTRRTPYILGAAIGIIIGIIAANIHLMFKLDALNAKLATAVEKLSISTVELKKELKKDR